MKLANRIFNREDWRVTSKFGNRIHPVTKVKSFHSGTDYGTQGQKWEQHALEQGVVLSSGIDSGGYGALFAWVSYPRLGIKCLHYHLDKVFVKRGQNVTHDTVIGTTGTSGRSTGIHLHLGIKHLSDDKYFDSETYDYIPLIVDDKIDEPNMVELKVGDKIWIKSTATRYSNGTIIPASRKKNGAYHTKPYTIQFDGDKHSNKLVHGYWLIKEITSYVKKGEVEKA